MKTVYTEDMKGITTSSSILRQLIENDMVYVDKTSYIWELVKNPARNFYFISRPRRFGKSLFCSTLASLFKGEKELFKGLYIYDKYDFKPYPVLRFELNNMPVLNIKGFISDLRYKVESAAEDYPISFNEDDEPSTMLSKAIDTLYRDYGEVVVIIDEYDAPLTAASTLNDFSIAEKIRSILNSFYATLKNKAEKIRFCFLTGVVKLSNLSIFSAMNNLVDLSMDKEFAGAFGYTDDELDEYFGEGIDEYLEANPRKYKSRDEFREKIREYYDGYRFSPKSDTRVYNPVSIGFFFYKGCDFENYWIWTGSTSSAIALARNTDLSKLFLTDEIKATLDSFVAFDISQIAGGEMAEDNISALL